MNRILRIRTAHLFRCNHSKHFSSKANNSSSGPVTFGSLLIMAIGGAGILFYYNVERNKRIKVSTPSIEMTSVGTPLLGGSWVLVNQDGMPVTDASYRGKYCILYFGFSYCPDICPSELVKIGNLMNALEKKGIPNSAVQPLFISVDPMRDSVGQLKHYSQDFHPTIEYLTGTTDQVALATKAFRVYFSKANENDEEDYLVDHSIVIYLISPEGKFLDFYTQRMQVSDIVDRMMKYIKK